MIEFKQSLAKFLTGESDFAKLQADLDIELAASPADAPKYLELLKNLYASGRLPQQVFEALARQISPPESSSAPPPSSPPSPESPAPDDDGGKTRFRPTAPPSTQPPAEKTPAAELPKQDDTHTRLRASARPSPSADMTGQGGQTGQFTTPTGQTGQTGQAGQTGRTGQTGQTGQASTGTSAWGSPDQWTGGTESSGAAPAVGSVLKGRFVLESIIGHGGMGIVFKAKDLRKEEAQDRNPYLAVKVLNEEFKQHPESLKALQRESRKAQDLAHPNISTVFDFDRDGGNVFMTMEYMDGESFDIFLKRYRDRGLPLEKGLPLVRDMAAGLSYAHARGIVHSDFKPANAFLTKNGVVKIFDFGIARAAKHSEGAGGEMTLFDAGTLGALTPAYATIAMIDGDDPDIRDDIYALGCVTYEVFTGRHPYKKRSALKARNAGMLLEPINGLNRRQMRSLQKALAFDRDDQPDSVDEFMDGLEPRQINKVQMAAGVVVVLLLVVILGTWIPSYLQERYLDKLIATLESGDDAQIEFVLPELQTGLTPAEQTIVYGDNTTARAELTDYFRRNVLEATDYLNGRFDFDAALELLDQADGLFPDSITMKELRDGPEGVETRKASAILALNEQFELALQNDQLIPGQGAGSAAEIRVILQSLEPQHDAVIGDQLPIAIAQEGRIALRRNDLDLALAFADSGLAILPTDAELLNLKDAVNSAVAESEAEQKVAELEQKLGSLSASSTLSDYAVVKTSIEELRDLRPNSAVVRDAISDLETTIVSASRAFVESRDFDAARNAVNAFANLVGSAFVTSQLAGIDQAAGQLVARIQNALDTIQAMANDGRFEPPNQARASEQVEGLAALGADAPTLELARNAIQQGYLSAARVARGRSDFEQAKALVNLGLQFQPDVTMAEFLRQELTDIDLAEQNMQAAATAAEADRQAAERASQISGLVAEFDRGIATDVLTIEDGRRLINTISRLQSLGDSGDVVVNGRDQIGDALLRQARSNAAAGDWDAARLLVAETRSLLPENRAARDYAVQIEDDYRRALANQAEAQLLATHDRYNELMRQTTVDRNWLDNVWQLRSQLEEDTDFLSTSEQEIAEKVSQEVTALADAGKVTDADELLKRAYIVLPNSELLSTASNALQAANTDAERRTAERAAQAQLQARIQSARDQIAANQFANARATLEGLRNELPADDPFLITEAPRLFADAYIRRAESNERAGRFEAALENLDQAATYVTGYVPVRTVRDRIAAAIEQRDAQPVEQPSPDRVAPDMTEQANLLADAISRTLTSSDPVNVATTSADLAELQRIAPDIYARRVNDMVRDSVTYLDTLNDRDAAQATARLAELRRIFPDDRSLQSYRVREVAVTVPTVRPPRGEDTCANPELPGLGANSRATCRDSIGGDKYGPRMVVIPAGGPANEPFGISKYEITISDYNNYCALSGKCGGRQGMSAALPLTNISAQEAMEYAAWLTEMTGFEYRLPNVSEWAYAAEAAGTGTQRRNYNCQIRGESGLVKGINLEDVRTGDANGWGLQNHIGNAREFVMSGQRFVAKGGSFEDAYDSCSVSLQVTHDGSADAVTGFRLLRRIGG